MYFYLYKLYIVNVDCTSKSARVINHSNSVLPPLTNMSTTMVCDVVNQLLDNSRRPADLLLQRTLILLAFEPNRFRFTPLMNKCVYKTVKSTV